MLKAKPERTAGLTQQKLPQWLLDYQRAYPVREPSVTEQIAELRAKLEQLKQELATLKMKS